MKQTRVQPARSAIKIAVICATALVILSFSLHSGANSNAQSEYVEHIAAQVAHRLGIYHPNLYFIHVLFPQDGWNLTNLLVRKISHFTEYAVFGILCTYIFGKMRHRGLAVIFNLAAGPLLALFDEKVVQLYFSVGRTSSFRDVLLDSMGFFAGTAVVTCIRFLIRPHRVRIANR